MVINNVKRPSESRRSSTSSTCGRKRVGGGGPLRKLFLEWHSTHNMRREMRIIVLVVHGLHYCPCLYWCGTFLNLLLDRLLFDGSCVSRNYTYAHSPSKVSNGVSSMNAGNRIINWRKMRKSFAFEYPVYAAINWRIPDFPFNMISSEDDGDKFIRLLRVAYSLFGWRRNTADKIMVPLRKILKLLWVVTASCAHDNRGSRLSSFQKK